MICVVDESPKFTFNNDRSKKDLALAAGLALPINECLTLSNYIETHYSDGLHGVKKGCKLNDAEIWQFLKKVLSTPNVFAACAPGDKIRITINEAIEYKKNHTNDLKEYILSEHSEYELLSLEKKRKLQSSVVEMFNELDQADPQDFYNLLMIFEVIIQIIQKYLDKIDQGHINPHKKLTILIDKQNEPINRLINKGLFFAYIFVYSRHTAFSSKYFGNRSSSLDITKLIDIRTVSDSDDKRIFYADYLANITQKCLTGTILDPDIIDLLAAIYKEKISLWQFHPTIQEMTREIPNEILYAYKQLIKF